MEAISTLIPGNLYFTDDYFGVYETADRTGSWTIIFYEVPFLLLEIKCLERPWLTLKILQSNRIGWIGGIDIKYYDLFIKPWTPRELLPD